MVKIEFETVNACFSENIEIEVARTLEAIKKKILDGREEGKIFDVNGNTIGRFEVILTDDQRANKLWGGNKMIKLVEPMEKNLVSDIHLVIDMSIFAVNVERLYREIWNPCKANLFKKYLKGNYDPMLARKMFYNHVPTVIMAYCAENRTVFKLTKYDKEFLANEILEHYVCDFEEEKKALEDEQ